MTADLRTKGLVGGYDCGRFWDEMVLGSGRPARPQCEPLLSALSGWDATEFERHVSRANATYQQLGITFTVYGDSRGAERLIPFDPIPRVISAVEWTTIDQGIQQRI